MENTDLISANDFCSSHHIEYSFIAELHEAGLVEIIAMEEQYFLHADQLKEVEQLVRFHDELDINIEGIEAITHLLHQLNSLQDEMRSMQQRLRMYEGT